jgi:hypothetical protein
VKDRFILKPQGLKRVETASMVGVDATLLHYFRPRRFEDEHERLKKLGLCPLCKRVFPDE